MKTTAALLALATSGCATVLTGTTQDIAIVTDPAGAACTLTREGGQIGNAAETPTTVTIEKSRSDVTVACKKAGFATATAVLPSTIQPATFGNILAGGLIGVAIDAGSGASRRYPEAISLPLTKLPEADAAPDPALPSS